jgi:hypothetical protein
MKEAVCSLCGKSFLADSEETICRECRLTKKFEEAMTCESDNEASKTLKVKLNSIKSSVRVKIGASSRKK